MTGPGTSGFSLRRRIQVLAFAAVVITAVALTVGSWMIDHYLIHDQVLKTRISAERAILDLVSDHTSPDLTARRSAELEEIAARNPEFWYYAEMDGNVFRSGPGEPRYKAFLRGAGSGLQLPEQAEECPFYADYYFAEEVVPPLRVVANKSCGDERYYIEIDGIVAAADSSLGWDDLLNVQSQVGVNTRRSILPTVVLAILLLGAVTLIFGSVTTRIREISSEAKRIGVDNHHIRLPEVDLPKEITPLVQAVNSAIGRLEDASEKQSLFVAAAAHELRTPLAIQRSKLEQLPESELKRELDENIERMASMIKRLLELAKLDVAKESFKSLSVARSAEEACVSRGSVALDKGIDLAFDVSDESAEIRGDSEAIQSAISNLIDNALMFAGNGGNVTVVVDGKTVTVSDSGPGVPERNKEQIFEPFFKNPPNKRGHGLGLAIVAEIMRLHGGTVSTHNDSSTGGAVFKLSFSSGD